MIKTRRSAGFSLPLISFVPFLKSSDLFSVSDFGFRVFTSSFLLASILLPLQAGDWPQWRGPTRDGHASIDSPRIVSLPKELNPIWRLPIGGGFSSPIVADGKLVYLDEQQGKEVAHLLAAANGKEIWSVPYATAFQDEWGAGPRATPLLDGERLYVQSCDGEFRCLNLSDGKTIWSANFENDFGMKFFGTKLTEGTAVRRGNNGCGVIASQRLVVPVGSTNNGATLVCFDKLNGKVLWKTGHDEVAYSSPIITTLAGIEQVVAFTAEALLGAQLEDGRILWRVPFRTDARRHAASPMIVGDTVLVNSHTFGLAATRISQDSAGLRATSAWLNRSLKINLSTPVLVGDYVYSQGVSPDYICADARTGELKWSQPGFAGGKEAYAATIVAGGKLLVLTHDGQLLLLAADPAKYTELGRLQVCGKTWSFPAYAKGILYIRDRRELLSLDLSDLGGK